MKGAFFLLLFFSSSTLPAQPRLSIATGLSGLRNFSKAQGFWAVGQSSQANVHVTAENSFYVTLDYYTEGSYRNRFTARAKSSTTNPQQVTYTATGRLGFRQLSMGLKRYFKGAYNSSSAVNLYGQAGFGLLFARIQNSFSGVDTLQYRVPVALGRDEAKRLTFDVGLGAELPLGGTFYAFSELRTWLPASDTPLALAHNQRNIPMPLMLTAGIRILFGFN